MTMFRNSFAVTGASFIVLCCCCVSARGQTSAEMQAAVQGYMKLMPTVGPSVARVAFSNADTPVAIGGFVVGKTNWVVTLGEHIDEDTTVKISFKKSAEIAVASVKYRDKQTGIVVLETAVETGRTPLEISSKEAKAKELELIFGVPEKVAVNMAFGVKGKSLTAAQAAMHIEPGVPKTVRLTQFISAGTAQGIGSPILQKDGSVVGMVVGKKEGGSQTEVYSFTAAELNRVVQTALDPQSAIATDTDSRQMSDGDAVASKELLSDSVVTDKPHESNAKPTGAEPPKIRTWKARSGSFSQQAKYVQQKAGMVQLELTSGKKIAVKISLLSDADQKYLSDLQ